MQLALEMEERAQSLFLLQYLISNICLKAPLLLTGLTLELHHFQKVEGARSSSLSYSFINYSLNTYYVPGSTLEPQNTQPRVIPTKIP